MTGAETMHGLAGKDAPAPVAPAVPQSIDLKDRRYRMRRNLLERLAELRGDEAPTVQEIEEKLWIEDYLKLNPLVETADSR